MRTVGSLMVFAASLGCASAPVETPPAVDPTVARWTGGSIYLSDLEAGVETELREIEVRRQLERYELLQRTLDARLDEELLTAERTRRGFATLEELFAAEVDARLGEPGVAEMQAAFERFQVNMTEATFEDAAPFLRVQLMEQLRAERRAMFMDELKARAGLHVDLPYPDIPRVRIPIYENNPSVGSADAPVVIIQFAELQCYYCRKAAPVLENLVKRHEGGVRVVFKDFPLSGHETARRGAVAAHCAAEQGRFWEMYRALVDQPERLGPSALREAASQLGLDVEAWSRCARDEVWEERIDDDVRDGRAAGVGVTPTFFVNGLLVAGAVPYARLDALVDRELARVGATSVHGAP